MKKIIAACVFALFVYGVWAVAQNYLEIPIERNIVYGTVDGVELKLDLARPLRMDGPAPAVVCIHGGAWMAGSKSDYGPIIRQFAAKGYVAVAVGYRLAPKFQWPAQIEDVKCAVRFLRANAAQYNIDPNRIGAVGDSAGGHLALLLGLMDPKDGFEGNGGNADQPSKVQAILNVYGPTNLKTWRVLPEAEADAAKSFGKSSEDMLASFVGTADRSSDLIAQASPITYIDSNDPPVLTFHGTKDAIVPFDQATELKAALEAAGVYHEFVPFEGGVHGLSPMEVAVVIQRAPVFFDKFLKRNSTTAAPAVESQ